MSGSAAAPSPRKVFQAEDVTKSFGAVQAIRRGSLTLFAGEVHALVGVNGAGKSTLSRIISGHERKTSGSLLLNGREVDFHSPRAAMDAGISLVMQETCIAPDLTVLENICLTEFGKAGRLRWKQLKERALLILDELGQVLNLPLDRRAGDLSMAQRQMLEICRALQQDSSIIIFDEPTASFSPSEVEHLFEIMRMLCKRGHALGFVSHRMEEIFEITDRVTVMREGNTIEEARATTDITTRELIRLMIGRDISDVYERPVRTDTQADTREREPLLAVEGLAVGSQVKDVSFTLHAGEILGLAGLVGAGRSETLEAVFGLRRKSGGTITLRGRPFEPKNPRDSIQNGIGLIGEDRRRQSLIPDFSVRENILLAHLGSCTAFHNNYDVKSAEVEALLTKLDMPEHLRFAPMLGLSGGQQQKAIVARWLLIQPSVLLLDEPTRGVDIGTRQIIYRVIREIASRGIGVVVVSSDFEEVLGLSDRVVVLSDGVSVTSAPSDLLDTEILTMYSAPRSSAESMRRVLERVSIDCGGSAYWMQLEHGRVFCIDIVGPDTANIGMSRGSFPLTKSTEIPLALTNPSDGRIVNDADYSSVLHHLTNKRGHAFGWIGVSKSNPFDSFPSDTNNVIAQALTEHGVNHIHVQCTESVEAL